MAVAAVPLRPMATHPPLREEGAAAAALDWLPAGWRAPEGPRLNLDAEIATGGEPPLDHPDGVFALITAREALPRAGASWAEWAAELRRLLAPGGIALAGLGTPAEFERLSGERWDDDEIGVSVLPGPDGSRAFHSDWWLRAHLGRAFELHGPSANGDAREVVLRAGADAPTAAELRAPEADEPRELAAAQAEASRLAALAERAEARHRRELDALREELGRELMRKALQATSGDAGFVSDSTAALVVAEYEGSRSWKVTRPLRAAGRMARRFR
jgi:hypothetical protein